MHVCLFRLIFLSKYISNNMPHQNEGEHISPYKGIRSIRNKPFCCIEIHNCLIAKGYESTSIEIKSYY